MSGESLTTTTSWFPAAAERWLGELIEGDDSRTYTTFADDDDFEYTFETWQFFILVLVVAFFIVCGIFYLSYRQEVCCGVHNNSSSSSREKNRADEDDIESGLKLATKTFQDSIAIDRIPDVNKNEAATDGDTSSSSSDCSSSSHTPGDASSTSSSTKRSESYSNKMQALVSTPRCVLCSKAYAVGECITHCSGPPSVVASCHHEFHETCLRKYWAENKANAGQCPVCKIQYCKTTEEEVATMSPSSSDSSPPPCQSA